jgi:hypothetical protein
MAAKKRRRKRKKKIEASKKARILGGQRGNAQRSQLYAALCLRARPGR